MIKKSHIFLLLSFMFISAQSVIASSHDAIEVDLIAHYVQKHQFAIQQSHLNFDSDPSKSEPRSVQLEREIQINQRAAEQAKKYVWGFQWLAYVTARLSQSDYRIAAEQDKLVTIVRPDLRAMKFKSAAAQEFSNFLNSDTMGYDQSDKEKALIDYAKYWNSGAMPILNQNENINQDFYPNLHKNVITISHPGYQIAKLKAENVREGYVPSVCSGPIDSGDGKQTSGIDRTLDIKAMLDKNFGI